MLRVLCLLLFLVGALSGMSFDDDILLDDIEMRFIERRRELAAEYRLERAAVAATLSAEHQAEATALAERIGELLQQGQLRDARRLARRAYASHGFAVAAPRILHGLLRGNALTGRMSDLRQNLLDLWERHPEYQHIGIALEEALLAAESIQSTGEAINLQADSPRNVIDRRQVGATSSANMVFRFLAQHGDPHRIAPRAYLGMARSLLFQAGSRRSLREARAAYESYLERYPRSELVFDALCELAIVQLLGYRGDHYDVGALFAAVETVNQAEVYAADDPERLDLIERYRAMIRRWHQERDLQVARWYRNKGHRGPARMYYDAVLRRDPASESAAAARRERESVADSPVSGLGGSER